MDSSVFSLPLNDNKTQKILRRHYIPPQNDKKIQTKSEQKKLTIRSAFILITKVYYLLSDFLKNTTYAPYNTIAAIATYNTFSAGPVAGVAGISG
jgi:hypothetical protein